MTPTVRATLVLVFALAGCSGNEPLVTSFATEDAQMNAAMEQARASLPKFEERLANPPASQSYIALKGRFEEDGTVEHMWIGDVAVSGEGYRGKLGNNPVYLKKIQMDQSVLVKRTDVSDWLAIDDGRLVGGYTLRVQRDRLPADKRAEFDSQMGFRIED
jgi:uncharacterized protein YegJ (DUF2314 family)